MLTGDIYAAAALAGETLMVVSRKLGLRHPAAAALGAVSCFALTMTAWHFG